MYLDIPGPIKTEDHTCSIETEDYAVWWEGVIFIKGMPSGRDSVEAFLQKVSEDGIEKACRYLCGQFSCILRDKAQDRYYAFVDNGGFSLLFHDDHKISTSFLSLIDNSKVTLQDLNPYAVIEFIHSGWILGETPFFNTINILSPDRILMSSDNGLESLRKDLEAIYSSSDPLSTFKKKLSEIATSLRNNRLRLHLTGGTDTRLLNSLFMNEGLNYDVSTVGRRGDPDVEIARRLAGIMGLKHYIHFPTVGDKESVLQELKDLFVLGDGLGDLFRLHQYGYHFQKDWYKGIDVLISGNGGELYKFANWWVLRRETREQTIDRLVRSGWANWYSGPQIPYDLFSNEYKKAALDYRPKLAKDLANRFEIGTGKDLADQIFLHYSVRGAHRNYTNGRVINTYAPLLERELVACAIAIPKYERFFSIFHRKLISSVNVEAARLETTDPLFGYAKLVSWVFKKSRRQASRVGRLLRRFQSRPSSGSGGPGSPIHDLVKNTDNGRESIQFLSKCGILRDNIPIEEIDNTSFGRLFSLAQLLMRVKI